MKANVFSPPKGLKMPLSLFYIKTWARGAGGSNNQLLDIITGRKNSTFMSRCCPRRIKVVELESTDCQDLLSIRCSEPKVKTDPNIGHVTNIKDIRLPLCGRENTNKVSFNIK